MIYFLMLGIGMRRRRDLGREFDDMIKFVWYVLVAIKNSQLTRNHDHESVRHVIQ